MIDLLQDGAVLWALVVALVLPLSIVAAGELDERLRQRQSPLRPAVEVLRNFALPLLARLDLADQSPQDVSA